MSLRAALTATRIGVLSAFHRRNVELPAPGPFVSFAFDDFPRTAYTTGGSILKNHGIRATYYVALGLLNTITNVGEQFRMEDLQGVAADGHEVASHTFAHSSGRKVPLRTFRDDVRKGDAELRNVAGLSPSANFAYPFGDVTLAAKRVLGEHMTSCRGVFGGLNGPRVDLNLLRANSLYGDASQMARVERLLRENEKQGTWLIFYTHDVRPNPSPYGCTPELLERAARLAAGSKAKVVPVAEVLASVKLKSTAA